MNVILFFNAASYGTKKEKEEGSEKEEGHKEEENVVLLRFNFFPKKSLHYARDFFVIKHPSPTFTPYFSAKFPIFKATSTRP